MIDLRKNEDADSRYAPGAVYLIAPDLRYGQLVKEAFGLTEHGPGVEPKVFLSIQDSPTITIAAKRMNIRSRYSDGVQSITFPVPEDDAVLRDRVDAFARRWFDLTDPIVGNLALPADAPAGKPAPDPLQTIIAFYVLKFHKMPPLRVLSLIGAEPLSTGSLSHIEIDTDTRVRLPLLLADPLPLNPLQRTVYILFMRHPGGIVLKNIADYAEELREIYAVVRPQATAERVASAIDNLCGMDGTLHQQLTRIRQNIVKALKNKRLADIYSIRGRHSDPYAISGLASGEVQAKFTRWLQLIPHTKC